MVKIHGHCDERFISVKDAFEQNFRHTLGNSQRYILKYTSYLTRTVQTYVTTRGPPVAITRIILHIKAFE